MIELPEALSLAEQITRVLIGKRIAKVLPPTKPHKFCWFSFEPENYEASLRDTELCGAKGFGIYVELQFSNGKKLCVNDGVILTYTSTMEDKKDYQLKIIFDDATALVFTVAMYGGIFLHSGEYNNEYYLKSLVSISPFSEEFEDHFYKLLGEAKKSMSAKAFLATEQRFPGIGNGVLQDILLEAGVNPRAKVAELNEEKQKTLFHAVISVLKKMYQEGGRDTERKLLGEPGGYRTNMSKKSYGKGCPICGGEIVKEAYLGGAVYYCPHCQPL